MNDVNDIYHHHWWAQAGRNTLNDGDIPIIIIKRLGGTLIFTHIYKAPVGLTKAPVALTKAPVALTNAPLALTKAPVALAKAPVAVTKAPPWR